MILCNKCNCIGHVFIKSLSTHSAREYNPYKILGLNPGATRSEIKSAFYELSKKHHPDKNQGCEKSAKIFKDITAAYELLRNEKLRAKFDRELSFKSKQKFSSVHSDEFSRSQRTTTHSRADYNDEAERHYYEKINKVKSRKYYGKTKYYDFDAWYKAHYANPYVYKYQRHQAEMNPHKINNQYSVSYESQNYKISLISSGFVIIFLYYILNK